MQGANFDKVLVDTWNDSVRKYKKRKRWYIRFSYLIKAAYWTCRKLIASYRRKRNREFYDGDIKKGNKREPLRIMLFRKKRKDRADRNADEYYGYICIMDERGHIKKNFCILVTKRK